jgi:hypothetical protein
MKRILALMLAAGAVASASAQVNVGVSIGINQPGVYGRINIGDLPQPALILPQPVIIAPAPRYVERRPIYLYVPTVHQRDWRRHCGRYAACGQPVYFVRDQWVRERYEHEHPGWKHGHHRGHDKHRGKGRGRDDDHRDDRRDDRGRGGPGR